MRSGSSRICTVAKHALFSEWIKRWFQGKTIKKRSCHEESRFVAVQHMDSNVNLTKFVKYRR